MARKYDTLDAAKAEVDALLRLANHDADRVFTSLTNTARLGRQFAGWTAEQDEDNAMLRLALADLTGNAEYRR